jgi:4-amino-4-deoxy-L-arabinose transferase-like glycosyltransferase
LLWYLLFAFDRVAFWVAGQFHLVSGDWEQSNLFATNQIAFFLLGRTLSVAFGTATLGVCYLLGRRLFSPAHGLLAAAFLACTFLHVRDSALATVDVPMTFFVGLSLLGAANVLRQGRTQDYLLAGVAAGLATATKYSAVLVPIALLVAHGVRTAWLGEPLRRLGTAPRLVAAVSSAALVFLAVNPYLLLDGSRAWADLQWLYYERLTVGQFADVGPAWWYHFAVSLRYGMGVGLLALALAGILGTIWRRDAGGLVLLSFAGCFYLVTGYFKLAFVRYMIPLLPVLCLFAAWALLSLTERFPRPARGWIAAGLGVLAVLEPVHAIGAYSGLVHHPDTRVQAYAFLRALPPGTQVAVYEPDVVWRSTIPSWRPAVYLDDPQHASPEVFADLKRQGIGYLLVHTSALAAVSPTVPELELALRRSATLAQAFSPYKTRATPHPVYDRVDPYYFPIGGFAGVVRPGPLVRLYRLD